MSLCFPDLNLMSLVDNKSVIQELNLIWCGDSDGNSRIESLHFIFKYYFVAYAVHLWNYSKIEH